VDLFREALRLAAASNRSGESYRRAKWPSLTSRCPAFASIESLIELAGGGRPVIGILAFGVGAVT